MVEEKSAIIFIRNKEEYVIEMNEKNKKGIQKTKNIKPTFCFS